MLIGSVSVSGAPGRSRGISSRGMKTHNREKEIAFGLSALILPYCRADQAFVSYTLTTILPKNCLLRSFS